MSFGSQEPDRVTRERLEREAAEAPFADVRVEHIARVYAQAFLGAAKNAGKLQELFEEFDSFLTDVLDRFPDLEKVLSSSLVSHDDKSKILDRTIGGQASPVLLSFLKVVSRHGRMNCLRPIHREAHEEYNRMQGRVRVRVTTATELDGSLAKRLVENLRRMAGGEPVLEQVVDPNVLGGIVVRVGDTIYDASIANQLEQMRQQMIDRSAHEIQSRRDRFRYSG